MSNVGVQVQYVSHDCNAQISGALLRKVPFFVRAKLSGIVLYLAFSEMCCRTEPSNRSSVYCGGFMAGHTKSDILLVTQNCMVSLKDLFTKLSFSGSASQITILINLHM